MSDIYKIAVNLSMASNASGVLAGLSKHFLKVHGDVEALEKRMTGLSRATAAVAGSFLLIGGVAVLGAFKKVTDHAKELSRELTMLKNLGLSDGVISGMQSAARAGTRSVAGSTESQNLKFQREAFSVFGAQNATTIMPYLSKYAQLSGDVNGGDYKKGEDDVIKIIRSGDLMGKFINEKTGLADPEKVKGFMDIIGKMVTAGGGMFDASTMLALAQQGGPALSNMSDDGLMSMFMAAQDMGGFRAGTAASSLKQQFTGGTMTKAVAAEAHRLGLIGSYKMSGQKVILGKDQTKFQGLLNTDMLGAGAELEKILSEKGYKSKNDQINELYKVLSRQTSQRLIADIIRNLANKTAERGRVKGVDTLDDQLKNFNSQDYGTNEHNLQSAFENLMQAIAGPASKVTIDVMQKMTVSLNSLTGTVRGLDPNAIVAVAQGIGILGVSMAGAGGAALLAALGPAGWVVLGIGALAGAFKAFAPKQFDEWLAGFLRLGDGIIHFDWKKIVDGLGMELTACFGLLPDKVKGAIESAVSGIADAIRGAFSGLGGKIHDFLTWHMSYGGAGPGGGGFTNASWGGSQGNLSGAARGSYAALGSGGSPSSLATYIRASAIRNGIDPRVAVAVANSEGLHSYVGDYGSSFGPFQLHMGGLAGSGNGGSGLGDAFRRATGKDPRDPNTVHDQIDFAMAYASKHGWSDWHGAARSGIGRMQGISAAPPPRAPIVIHNHNTMHLDGKVVAKSVTKHQVDDNVMPRHIGGHDSYGSYLGPGSTMFGT